MHFGLGFSITDPLYSAFGWTIQQFYALLGNYGFAVIFFTLFIKIILIPLGAKTHKSTLLKAALQPQVDELNRIYGKDREKLSQATMELYKKNGTSMSAGCLPQLLVIFLIWPMYRVVSGPLYYIMNISEANLVKISEYLKNLNVLTSSLDPKTYNLPILQSLSEHPSVFAQVVDDGLMKTNQLINLQFFGLNLGLIPTWRPSLLLGDNKWVWLPLLIIPIATVISAYIPQIVNKKTNPQIVERERQKKLAAQNPARKGQVSNVQDQTEGMMKVMPFMSLFFSFLMPAGVGLYIIVSNLMAAVQSIVFHYVYTVPFQKKMEKIKEEQNALLGVKSTDQ